MAEGAALGLAGHLAYLEEALAEAGAAPLSTRRAMLVAHLAAAFVDRLFDADPAGDDILVFRDRVTARTPALGLVLGLASNRPDRPVLALDTVGVPLEDYPGLDLADFMVSLYNGHTVQQVRIVSPDGARVPVHPVLAEALEALRRCLD